MASVYVTLRIMPEDPAINLDFIEKEARVHMEKAGVVHSVERVPIAFGLVSLDFILMVDEKKGGTEKLENELSKIPGVSSVQVTDVRRGIG
ncbi:MAG: elongation factor 1-beta [Candidatus Woesearchaeota archaeon]|nr:elongation factor 1-beta [Candidatus Woesearchaeota archaeon]